MSFNNNNLTLAEQVASMRERAKQLHRDAKALEDSANTIESRCNHKWSAPKYDPIITKGYQTPGDPPGTMGVDWRGPCYIEGTTKDRWTRVCSVCGKVETTTHADFETKTTKYPRF